MGQRAFTPPLAGLTACSWHQPIYHAGPFSSVTLPLDRPAAAGVTRLIFILAAGSPADVTQVTELVGPSVGSTYALTTPLTTVAAPGAVPIPSGTMYRAAIASAQGALAASVTIHFGSTLSGLLYVIQHWT